MGWVNIRYMAWRASSTVSVEMELVIHFVCGGGWCLDVISIGSSSTHVHGAFMQPASLCFVRGLSRLWHGITFSNMAG